VIKQHPVVHVENFVAQTMADLITSLVKRSMHQVAWHLWGFPGRFPALLSPDSQAAVLGEMRAVWEGYGKAQDWRETAWKNVRERSVLDDMYCRRVFEIARSSNWQVTDDLLKAVRMPFTTLGGTAINEHGVRELRQQEQMRSGWKKQVANNKKWDALVSSTVISGVHKYREVPWRAEVAPRNMSQGLIEGVFSPDPALCPSWVRSVVGPNSKTKWYSPAPLSAIQQSIDMQFVKHFDGLGDPRRITDV